MPSAPLTVQEQRLASTLLLAPALRPPTITGTSLKVIVEPSSEFAKLSAVLSPTRP